MKKLLLMIAVFIALFNSNSFAYSESFDLMIEVMGVSIKNINNKYLNEEIYNKYSLFVYGNPTDGYIGQRWKNVEDGMWNNGLTNGEYWILGENKEGYEVHNHKFPVDIEPPTTPEQWRYAYIPDAQDSWLDQSKYMDDYQKDYMLNTNLMRNNVTYNITVNQIGTDKVRLENYATWKTKGSVYTQRYDMNNKKWAANFMVPPMAGDAMLEGFAKFPNGTSYNLDEGKNMVNIPIDFGCDVTHLSDYAKPEHVKEIKSELYVNGALVDTVKGVESISIEKSSHYKAIKTTSNTVSLNVSVKSSLVTKFTTDGALIDIKNYILRVYFDDYQEQAVVEMVEEVIEENDPYIENDTYYKNVRDTYEEDDEEIPPPHISQIEIKKIQNGKEENLLISKKTNNAFVCAGQTIKIYASVVGEVSRATLYFNGDSSIFTFDSITKKLEWDEPKNRNEKTFFKTLDQFKKMYNPTLKLKVEDSDDYSTTYSYTYIIPYGTRQTLHSWNSLRQISNDAFSINENMLFDRIMSPYQIVIKAEGPGGETTKRESLDVFERWDTIYNRNIKAYIK